MSEQLTVPPERPRSPFAEFVTGFLAGIGALLLTWLLTLWLSDSLLKTTGFDSKIHVFAVTWAALFLGCGFLIEFVRRREERSSVFVAGLLTSAAIFLLLDAACWNFSLG